MYCSKCGAKLNDVAKFCNGCGSSISVVDVPPEQPVHSLSAQHTQPAPQQYHGQPQVTQYEPKAMPEKKKSIFQKWWFWLLVVVGIIIVIIIASSGSSSSSTPSSSNNNRPPSPASTPRPVIESTPEPTPEPTPDAQAGQDDDDPPPPDTQPGVDWRQWLSDYEEWVDEYIDFMERYAENPSDLSLLTEYMEFMTRLIEWTEQAAEIELDLVNDPAALTAYLETMSRILQRLAEVEI